MPKRPPQPYAAAPTTSSVVAPSRSSDDTSRTNRGWDSSSTKQIIRDLIAEYSTSDVVQTAKDCLTLNAMLEDKQREVVAQADAQIDALQAQIDEANAARGAATDDLRAHTEHIAQLESEAAELRRRNDALTSARREAEARVARFKAEADEQIDGIDAVEAHRMEEVPKIQMQIALYAKVVRIKWDYDESVGGVLKGEVAVPSKGVCRQFEIDSTEHDDYDIANELWALMEGKQPAIIC
mmetsp:Transcript_24526/g.53138  ORF Transcript_24526/g.53138 Transcript_24526/m.53138 type:complete len:239 (+) Transcript_24526:179-895(+)|eukprot:CAMPEP_0178513016 /NCGR_PEP_ID=MMETSP0696-20121128/23237_1 /TAXON_ID=265572 /ORGANISM="Extubocellulus spinifer, Strain CCMP396" /LENGTH=238 /DNA_ID=CAMNT_0020142961 /DNA_START=207 /DNA_END=923 /DNA_ORIENTATION=+